jgi:hypothetical protein
MASYYEEAEIVNYALPFKDDTSMLMKRMLKDRMSKVDLATDKSLDEFRVRLLGYCYDHKCDFAFLDSFKYTPVQNKAH